MHIRDIRGIFYVNLICMRDIEEHPLFIVVIMPNLDLSIFQRQSNQAMKQWPNVAKHVAYNLHGGEGG